MSAMPARPRLRSALTRGIAIALLAGFCAPPAALAQDFPIEFLRMMAARRGAPPASVRTLRQLLAAQPMAEAEKSRVAAILDAAEKDAAAGRTAAAQRGLAEARAALAGTPWTPAQAFASSLDVAPRTPILDAARPVAMKIGASYEAVTPPGARLRLSLERRGGPAISLGEKPLVARRTETVTVAIPAAMATGRYAFISEIVVDGASLARSSAQVDVVRDLASAEARAERRLAAVKASEDAAATVRYPYALAKSVASGQRELERPPLADRLTRSDDVLTALEAGLDPIRHGVGDQRRAYRLSGADELMPLRIYVPTTWKPGTALPIVLALHGGGGDENEMLEVDGGKFGKLAERYGYIVVSPFGYRPVGAWGSPITLPSVYGSTTKEGRAVGGPERARMLELSEKDALTALDRIATEYGADRKRMFVTGHSMGGGGTWYLAHKHRALWAGAAASAGPFFVDGYDLERLRGMGVMIVQGEGDPPSLAADRKLAADLLIRGIGVTYLETPSVNHGQTFGASLPSIFEFFERQRLRGNPTIKLPLK
ncbi:hypothetical protein [Sphingomonas sp. M1-B02]|uniref:hypothetical protein n=1 Tax=Sphingomonas sp. M1-B02 TaxID=3114300 RepID=UPI00223F3E2F|nr:hypothetical protein [Sphingomonas sp. S6-11]UZK65363.1 hypothetical protein OKW87_12695 [Sphingomonas sp. S6-11]